MLLIKSSVLIVASPSQNGYSKDIFGPVLISSLWNLFYNTVIPDETMDYYKSLVMHLRYSPIKKTWTQLKYNDNI